MRDQHVRREEFLTLDEVLLLGERCTFLAPASTLISRRAVIGSGNVFYPGVVLRCDERSELTIGEDNEFFPGSFVLASSGGRVELGSRGSYGPGGVQVKANRSGVVITIGDDVRLGNGPEIVGGSTIGDGAQVVGPIQAQSVVLAAGGAHSEPDPDRRAAVLKGVGLARDIKLGVGEVINGLGDFAAAPVERQRVYHPRA